MISALRDFYDDVSVSFDLSRLDPRPLRQRLAFDGHARAGLYRHLAVQRANGITVEQALEKYVARLLKRGKNTVASVVQVIELRYRNARSLAAALDGFVPVSEIVLIASAEQSGNLSAILDRMLEARDSTKKIQRILLTSLLPPIAYLWAIWGVLSVVGGQVVPSMVNSNSTANVHGLGLMVLELGRVATSPYVIAPPLGTVAVLFWFVWSLPRWIGKYRRIADNYFPFSYYRDIQGFMWLLAITSLQQAGMDLKEALQEQIRFASPWLRERLTRIEWLYGSASRSFADALAESGYEFPNPDLIDDIGSLSEFPDFSDRINKRAVQWSQELEYAATQRVTWGGILFEITIFGFIAALTQGITDLANAMGSTFN